MVWLSTLFYLETINWKPFVRTSVAILVNRISAIVSIFIFFENIANFWVHLWRHISQHQNVLGQNFFLLSWWFTGPLVLLLLPFSLISLTLFGLLYDKFTPREFHEVNIAIDVIFLLVVRIYVIVAFFAAHSLDYIVAWIVLTQVLTLLHFYI